MLLAASPNGSCTLPPRAEQVGAQPDEEAEAVVLLRQPLEEALIRRRQRRAQGVQQRRQRLVANDGTLWQGEWEAERHLAAEEAAHAARVGTAPAVRLEHAAHLAPLVGRQEVEEGRGLREAARAAEEQSKQETAREEEPDVAA